MEQRERGENNECSARYQNRSMLSFTAKVMQANVKKDTIVPMCHNEYNNELIYICTLIDTTNKRRPLLRRVGSW